ncbi:MAG TPA: DoxX family membrane protein [Phycisphaerae bacterium]|nr:DoxX family membrane protein [Phycisphaerae bacterium]HRY69106.1 DoxX family membrane protein [Phycisphaerae bacterium]HSA29452.1 DoxX family membrane protein [Phycisphaerae bacterium]
MLHLSVLIENLRREGYELAVGKPKVIYRERDGKKTEPIELCTIDVPAQHVGSVMELLGGRRGICTRMETRGEYTHMEFTVPARGLIGVRNRLLNATNGTAIMYHNFYEYEYLRGSIPGRANGVLIASEAGQVTAYALDGLADRGMMFVRPTDPIYEGMIVGEHCKDNDIVVNVCRAKKMSFWWRSIVVTDTTRWLILIRLMVGGVFLSEGIQRFLYPNELAAGRFLRIGIPVPDVMGPFVGVVETVCGAMVLLGLLIRPAALILLINISVAILSTKIPILLGHGFWTFSLPKLARYGFWSMAHEARTDFCMWMGLLFLLLVGAGALSVDAFMERTRGRKDAAARPGGPGAPTSATEHRPRLGSTMPADRPLAVAEAPRKPPAARESRGLAPELDPRVLRSIITQP